MKITVRIDCNATGSDAVFENKGEPGAKSWLSLCNFLRDNVPIEAVIYSRFSITLPWRQFLSIQSALELYFKAHSDWYELEFTERVWQQARRSYKTGYEQQVRFQKCRTEEEIKDCLTRIGFSRRLTENQLHNLVKISHFSAAATFSVPGAGKTTEALSYFFINADASDKLLVIAPKNAFGAWEEQLEACSDGLGIVNFVRLTGGEAAINAALKAKPRFSLITYEQLIRVKNLIFQFLLQEDIFLFLDESHRVKGGKSTRRVEAVLALASLPKRKLILSGTPMPQGPRDLISQFLFLYPDKTGVVNEANVVSMIHPVYVRTTKGELGIPPLRHEVKMIPMSPVQREVYLTLKSEMARKLNPHLSDFSRGELRRIGKCVLKVLEFVSNPALLADHLEYAFDPRITNVLLSAESPKIAYTCRRTRELASENKKVLIWSSFVKNTEYLAFRLSDLGAEYIHGGVDAGDEDDSDTREGKIKRFHNDPSCKVLVANPAACSEGISLHRVCQHAIYLDRSFNAAHYMQSEDRIHRLGLSPDANPVVEFVECEDSVDQVVRARLEAKVSRMAKALEDSSLTVAIDEIEYDEEADEVDSLTVQDAEAVLRYFFPQSAR